MRYEDVMVGDRVEFLTPQGQTRRGKVVMMGDVGYIVNCGGRFGTPAVLTEKNFITARKGRDRRPDYFGAFLRGAK